MTTGKTEDAAPDTFPKFLHRHAMERPERPAFREKARGIWRTTTWRNLSEEAAALAAALSERGVQRGAHVAFLGDNKPRLYAAMCAVHSLGAVAVPLYQDATADELIAPIQSAQVTHVFAENQEQVDKILQILPQCPTVRCIVHDRDRGMRHYRQPQLVSYNDLLREGRDLAASKREALRAEAARGSGNDAAFLFFTSGTSGRAKGVILTHGSLIDRGRVLAKTQGLTDVDVVMAYLPPGWIGQNLFGYVLPMVTGYCVCCPESSDTMLSDMREMGPTCFLGTPRVLEALLTQVSTRIEDTGGFTRTLYRRCMDVAHRRLMGGEKQGSIGDRLLSMIGNVLIFGPIRDVLGMSKLRAAYTAGDAIAPDVLMFFRALGVNLKQLYGSTETGFLVAVQRDDAVKPDSVGPVADGVELKFSADREILVRSPGLFREYHGDPQTTSQARSGDGWYHTGDAGYLDADGHLRIVDRINDIGTLSGGATYSPRLIESKLKCLSYITEVVTFGDGRDMVCALVDIDAATVGRWADKKTLSYTGRVDLASRDEVYALIAGCIARINAELEGEPALAKSQIRKFALLPKELSADDGMLTRTGKLRRGAIADRYRSLVEAMYGGGRDAHVRIGDDVPPAVVKIVDVKAAAPAQPRRAA